MIEGLGQPRSRAALDAEWARKYHSVERVEWVRRQPSILSGDRPCVNAHVGIEGLGRKANYTKIVPLTKAEHDEIEAPRGGIKTFCRKYGMTIEWLLEQAAKTEERWQAYAAVERAW